MQSASQLPQHPFYTLPAELILDIIEYLTPDAFINLAFANYPLLVVNGLAPALSSATMSHLARQSHISSHLRLLPFPTEVTLQVLRRMRPIDIMNFVMANYQNLAREGIAPALTPETLQQLRRAVHPEQDPSPSLPIGVLEGIR